MSTERRHCCSPHLYRGFFLVLGGLLLVFLTNDDLYHFQLLLSLAAVALFIGFPLMGLGLFAVREDSIVAVTAVCLAGAALWMLLMGWGIEYLRQAGVRWGERDWTRESSAHVCGLGKTLGKGGQMEWAVYEFSAENGRRYESAVRNNGHLLRLDDKVRVKYILYWPRWSTVETSARQ